MRFGEVLVLADEHNHRAPKVLCLVLLQSVANDFGFADVGQAVAGVGVDPKQEVDARALQLIPREQVFEFGTWCSQRLPGPVGHLANAQPSRVAVG